MALTLTMHQAAMVERRALEAGAALMGEDDFRAFYERTARPLWGYLARTTGSPQAADDLLQEAYFRFYRAGTRHDSEAHRRNSLFQIATNLARDAARRGKRRPEVALPEEATPGAAELASAAPAPDREVAARADLARAMAELQPLQRQLLWLAYAQGESHEHIAAVLGLRTLSVKTLLLRARRKLAGLLTAAGGGR